MKEVISFLDLSFLFFVVVCVLYYLCLFFQHGIQNKEISVKELEKHKLYSRIMTYIVFVVAIGFSAFDSYYPTIEALTQGLANCYSFMFVAGAAMTLSWALVALMTYKLGLLKRNI